MKRDDCTGLALGGNKGRKLEFLVAEALAQGADTLITTGGVQSNHCRYTAAAAAKHGLACELILSRQVPITNPAYETGGNVLLDDMFGANVRFVDGDCDWDEEIELTADRIRSNGGRPYPVPLGGSSTIGNLGYVICAEEMSLQLQANSIDPAAIFLASGTGGSQAGLTVGLNMVDRGNIPVLGVSVSIEEKQQTRNVGKLVGELAAVLDVDVDSRAQVDGRFIGEGYGIPSLEMLEALDLCARLEGLLLDPVYTGKAFAGLISRVRGGEFSRKDTVIFIHTGGTPALWAYEKQLHRKTA